MTHPRLRTTAAWATTAVLGVVVAFGATAAMAESPRTGLVSVSAEKAADPGKGGKRVKAAIVRGIHGEFVARRGGEFVTVQTQKGKVTSADAASLTVKSDDGFTRTYALDAATTVKRRGEKGAATAKVGDNVIVVAHGQGEKPTAKRVLIRPAK